MQTSPLLPVLDATPIPGPRRTDGRRHAPRSIGEALLWAAERWGRKEDAVPRTTTELIDATADLVSRVIRDDRRTFDALREEALKLQAEIGEQMEEFGKANGPRVVNPATRADYVLDLILNHATLLGTGVRS
jgi:hypothetical protein